MKHVVTNHRPPGQVHNQSHLQLTDTYRKHNEHKRIEHTYIFNPSNLIITAKSYLLPASHVILDDNNWHFIVIPHAISMIIIISRRWTYYFTCYPGAIQHLQTNDGLVLYKLSFTLLHHLWIHLQQSAHNSQFLSYICYKTIYLSSLPYLFWYSHFPIIHLL